MKIIRLIWVFILFGISIFFDSCKKELSKEILITNGDHSPPTLHSVVLYGTIVDPGSGIMEYGHCLSKVGTPQYDEENSSKLGIRNSAGDFQSVFETLEANTTYYYRVYAIGGSGQLVYGSAIGNFTTADYGATWVSNCHVDTLDIDSYKATASITDLGEGIDSLLSHGFCWSNVNTVPSLSDNKCNLGVLKIPSNNFFYILNNLGNNKTYYIRAYAARKNDDVAYSSSVTSFKTLSTSGHPPVITSDPPYKTYFDRLFSYQVTATDEDGDPLTYTLIEKPPGFTINASTGLITAYPNNDLKGTHPITVRVSDNQGLYDTQSFNLLITIETSSFTDPRDLITYATVRIGDQWWMAENLKATLYRNGALIGTTNPATLNISGESTPKYQWAFDGNESYVSTYGRLYTWHAATDSRGLCPAGWHLPSYSEWNTLINFLIENGYNYDGSTSGNYFAKSLASSTGWTSSTTPGAVGNTDYPAKRNVTGFTALPGGCKRDDNGAFDFLIWDGFWWSSANYDANRAWLFRIDSGISDATFSFSNKWNGYSVRCIMD